MTRFSQEGSTIFPTKFNPKGLIICFFLVFLAMCIGVFSSCLAVHKPWVEGKCAAYGELAWLADKNVAVTHDIQAKGAAKPLEARPSMLVYGEPYDEFDRSILGLYTLELVSSGTKEDYAHLVSRQSKDDLLTPPSPLINFKSFIRDILSWVETGFPKRI